MERIARSIGEQTQQARRAISHTIISFVIRLLVGTGILFILFQLVSLQAIGQTLQQARMDFIALALTLLVPNIGLQIWKWHYLLRLASPQVLFVQSLGSFLFGVTIGAFTPGQLGEFGGRVVGYRTMHPLKVVHLTFIDKFQILLLICIGGISACSYFFLPSLWQRISLTVVSTSALLFFFFRPLTLKPFVQFVIPKKFFTKWFDEFFNAVAILQPKDLLYTFLLTLLFYGVLAFQMYLLLNAFSPVGSLYAFLGFAAMMFAKSLLPISLADLGIREVGSVYFYSRLSVPESAALNASLLLFTINILLPSLIGLFFLPKFSFRNKENITDSRTT